MFLSINVTKSWQIFDFIGIPIPVSEITVKGNSRSSARALFDRSYMYDLLVVFSSNHVIILYRFEIGLYSRAHIGIIANFSYLIFLTCYFNFFRWSCSNVSTPFGMSAQCLQYIEVELHLEEEVYRYLTCCVKRSANFCHFTKTTNTWKAKWQRMVKRWPSRCLQS